MRPFVLLVLVAACALVQAYPDCHDCKDGEVTTGCPDPGACGFEPACGHCMDGHPMPDCPDPARCGWKPSCMHCQKHATPDCPQPDLCAQCDGCEDRRVTPGCPLPHKCGFKPACTDCMDHPMPQCPDPDVCVGEACVMRMLFGMSVDTCVLFESWHVTNGVQYFGTVVAIVAICVLREGLSAYRNCGQGASGRRGKSLQRGGDVSTRGLEAPILGAQGLSTGRDVTFKSSLIDSLFYLCNITLSYIIMLIFMTYNGGLCIAVVLGCTAGYFGFAYYFRRRACSLNPPQAVAEDCCGPEPGI